MNLPKVLGKFKFSKTTPGTIVFKNEEGRSIYVFPKDFFADMSDNKGKDPKEIEVLIRVTKW